MVKTDFKHKTKFILKLKDKFVHKIRPNNDNVSFFKLLSFSDWLDKILMIVGILVASSTGALYPFTFLTLGDTTKTLLDFEQIRNNSKLINLTNSSINLTVKIAELDSSVQQSVNKCLLYGFISVFLLYIARVTWETSNERQIKKLRIKLYESIIHQEIDFFENTSPGELGSILNKNLGIVKIGTGYKVSDFVYMASKSLASIVTAMIMGWKFAIIYFALIPIMVLAGALMTIMVRKYTNSELNTYGEAGQIAQEALSSIRTVLTFGLVEASIDKYSNKLDKVLIVSRKKSLISGIFGGMYAGFFTTFFAIGFYYGVHLVVTEPDNYNLGNVFQSFFLAFQTAFSFSQAIPCLKEITEATVAGKKVFEILEKKPKIKSNGKKLENLNGEIVFSDVYFSYPSRPENKVLTGLSFNLPAGKTIALVGPSGGGKSTVVSLIQKFYNIQSGRIIIDGNDIDDLDMHWFRNQMAFVTQEPILFSTSIKENIRYGKLDASDSEIEQAAKMANAHDFIMSTENQYDTLVGEKGSQLSGGQKQRIAIARALIRNPKILLLDEATSALDYESERTVKDALDKAKVGRTTIVIAHRLSTIKNADLIGFISNGQLKEIGTHDELMNAKGLYFNLVDSELESKTVQNENNIEISTVEDKKRNTITIKEETSKKNKGPFYYERRVFKKQKPETIFIILGITGSICAGVIFPITGMLFTKIFIVLNLRVNEQEGEGLKYMGILFGIAAANALANFSYNFFISYSAARLTRRIQFGMFKSMMRQEIGFHDLKQNNSSILTTQLSSTASLCAGLTTDKLGIISQAVASISFGLIFGLVLSWKFTLVIFIFVPFTFLLGFLVSRSTDNSFDQEAGRVIIETIESIKTIRSLDREEFFTKKFKEIYEKRIAKKYLMFHIVAVLMSILLNMLFFIQAVTFSYGYYLAKNNSLEPIDIIYIFSSLIFSTLNLIRVLYQLPDQTKSESACKIAFSIIDRKSKIDCLSDDGLKPNTFRGDIRFENVHFRYPSRPQIKILNGLNLDIKKGMKNALIGSSGCGKSTVISLLLRFYDVDEGEVYLDGTDIRRLNIKWLRSKIGLVSQEPVLFKTTIFENISMGDISRDKINMSEIVDVATMANIHNKIESLPQKYETLVGSKGNELSGGEKQRIAIARALIRNPCIFLLDEASSALDNESESIVQDALDKAQVDRTCIVIAHKLKSIQNCNKISFLKKGVVVEEGNHDDLMNKKGFYYELKLKYD
nr:ATP-binding cassette subfamily B1-like 4-2 [Brachionus rubens]